MSDLDFMRHALSLARDAAALGEVPVGCVVVRDGEIIATGVNQRESSHDPSAHAEIVALRAAGERLGQWRLDDVTVYVTLEPCVMCAGALVNARVARVVMGATDLKAGAVGSRYNLLTDPRLLHEPALTYDLLADECAQVLSDFFEARRAEK
jgi:tRNA(adenine34) deaminase